MTDQEFNEKYNNYLTDGYDGCNLNIAECIEWLDKVFEALILIPDFTYQQVKWKFGKARFYCENSCINPYLIEQKLNQIYDNRKTTNR